MEPQDSGSASEPSRGDSGVAAIVIHYGDPALTERALASLGAGSVRPAVTVVVDNAPVPLELLDAGEVRLLRPGSNLGFAPGVQHALASLGPGSFRHVWLVNNDAVADPAALAELLAAAARHPRALVSSSVIDERAGDVWFHRGRYQPWRLETRHEKVDSAGDDDLVWTERPSWRSATYLPGASLLIPAAALDEVGGLDPSFFLYGEDVDFSIRGGRAGWAFVLSRRSSGTPSRRRYRLMWAASTRITARYHPWLLPSAVVVALAAATKRSLASRDPWHVTQRALSIVDAARAVTNAPRARGHRATDPLSATPSSDAA